MRRPALGWSCGGTLDEGQSRAESTVTSTSEKGPAVASVIGSAATPHDILAKTPFFADTLDASALQALSSRLRLSDYARGAILIREDAVGSSMFVLTEGEVAVTVPGTGKARPVAILQAPDIFGEMSLLTGARRAATVTARTPVRAIEISKAALAPLIAASPQLADRFAATLARRQRELDRIYRGAGRWNIFASGEGEVGSVIRRFFNGSSV
jgi:signal-transduction protein with cAMP-binding, CBS, and nucleotidyltransferase domain